MIRTDSCRICRAGIEPFMTFGRMPLANAFLTEAEIPNEPFYELMPAMCERCGAFQLIEQPEPQRMFNDRYPFFSGSSLGMQAHFREFAGQVIDRQLRNRSNPFVVELGSNDGTMLRHFRDAGCRHLGIDASESVAARARSLGLETLSAFFDEATAAVARDRYGPADVIVAANVICHIADIHSVAAGIARLLTADGMLIFEDPYLGAMLARTSYDQIYDEHVFMLSLGAVAHVFGAHGLELVEVTPLSAHGGSMRYTLAARGRRQVSPAVDVWMARERREGLSDRRTYEAFRNRCEASRRSLVTTLEDARRHGKRVAGYGATSKSTTILNYCGLGTAQIEFIADSTPAKQGKLTPGSHIPVKSPEAFRTTPPDWAVLFAWNHADEIFAKEGRFTDQGGRWIFPITNFVQCAHSPHFEP